MRHVKPGSILRAADGRRFVVKAIHKAEPHSGFSSVIAFEPQPMPLEPNKALPKRKKPRRNKRWFR